MDKNHNILFDPADSELIARFTSYMVKVVTTAKIDYIRRQSHWSMELPTDKLSKPDDATPETERWLNAASENEFFFAEERISDAFSGLPQMRRRILELSFIDGMSAMEIAEHLGCSVKFVYNERHSAIKKLRDLLLKGDERYE